MQNMNVREKELADVLKAISIVSGRLARQLNRLSGHTSKKKGAKQNERTIHDHYGTAPVR